jgi:signal transduction histidine kinase
MNLKKVTILAFILIFILILGLSFYYLYNSPTIGVTFTWDHEIRHHTVSASEPWSRLKTGDVLIGIGGQKVTYLDLLNDNIYLKSREELFSWLEAKKEIFHILSRPSITFRVLRDGKEMEVLVTPRKAGASFLKNLVFLHIIAGTVFFLIGIGVFYKKGPEEVSLIFLAMCLALMLVFITNATSLMSEIIYQPGYLRLMNLVNIAALPIGNALLFHFSLLLPRKRKFLERFPWLVPLFYGICLLIVASLQIPLINFLVAIFAPLTIVSIVYAFFAYKGPIEKQQMKWVLAGFIFGLGPWIFINAIPLMITGQRLMNDTIPAAFVVFIPLFMAFAIGKYRLMDIDAFLEGSFVYVITILLLGVADFSFLGMIGTRFAAAHPFDDVLLSSALVVSFYVVLRDRIRLLAGKAFGRVMLPETDIIARFNDRASGEPPEGIIQIFAGVVRETYRPKKITLAVKGEADALGILRSFSGQTGLIKLWEVPRFSSWLPREFYLALVMAKEQEPDAVLMLGGLQSKKFYSRHDLAVLNALLVQAKTIYENAVLYEENLRQRSARLMEEQRHLKEKEMILKDLHDGIGGVASNIHLLAETALASSSLDDAKQTLLAISGLSKEGLFEVRSFLQSLDTTEATFEALIAELRHLGSTMVTPHQIRFHLESAGLPGDLQPGRLFFLNVLRIYKEALTNVIKHSLAKSVTAKIVFADERFNLSISDDGIGLAEGRGKGRGINHMKTRAKDIGGRLSISSGEGACVYLEVPILYPE